MGTSKMAETFKTELTELLGIKYPIMLAGMASISNHEVAAAVSNAGGIGSFGGVSMSPNALRKEIQMCKKLLNPGAKFGVDLLLPQVGGSARKTNKDYTGGTLDQMVDIIIEEEVPLFISAVGVPPKWVVEKFHAAGIVCANMVGAPHHVNKALDVGIDLIIAQGTEAGGHTGDIATSVLIPQCVDICKGRTNFFGRSVSVVAAGGIYDGRGLAASLMWGASGVWVGTRFIACEEAGSSPGHRKRVLAAESKDTTRTIAFTGRPCRVMKTPYVKSWMERPEEEKALPSEFFPALMGQCVGGITSVNTAAEIVDSMMVEAFDALNAGVSFRSKLETNLIKVV